MEKQGTESTAASRKGAAGKNGVPKGAKSKSASKQATTDLENVVLSKIDIVPGKNPRKTITDTSLDELGASIKKHSLLQPIGLEPSSKAGRFNLLWGERRLRALRKLKVKDTKAVVRRNFAPVAQDASRFIENMQREDVNVLEEAQGLKAFMDSHKLTAKQVSETLGVKQSFLSQRFKLLEMPKAIQEALSKGEINFTQARELGRMNNKDAVTTLGTMAEKDGKQNRAQDIKNRVETKRAQKNLKGGKQRGRPPRTKADAPNIMRQTLEEATVNLNAFKLVTRPKKELKEGLARVYERFSNTRSEEKKEQYRGAVMVMEWALGIRDEI
jgi:ParB family chromosome partitioning protein